MRVQENLKMRQTELSQNFPIINHPALAHVTAERIFSTNDQTMASALNPGRTSSISSCPPRSGRSGMSRMECRGRHSTRRWKGFISGLRCPSLISFLADLATTPWQDVHNVLVVEVGDKIVPVGYLDDAWVVRFLHLVTNVAVDALEEHSDREAGQGSGALRVHIKAMSRRRGTPFCSQSVRRLCGDPTRPQRRPAHTPPAAVGASPNYLRVPRPSH